MGSTEVITEAVQVLQKGGVIALPTDTVYGLAALPDHREAIERIYRTKGRDFGKPLQLLLARIEDISLVAKDIPEIAWALARAFLPGGLTLVLWKQPSVPDYVTAGLPTVGVRVPAHPFCLAVVEALGGPLAATSANISGYPSPVTADEVRQQLGDMVDLILDGGRCPTGRDSTVLDLTSPVPILLRDGAVPKNAIDRILGEKLQKGLISSYRGNI